MLLFTRGECHDETIVRIPQAQGTRPHQPGVMRVANQILGITSEPHLSSHALAFRQARLLPRQTRLMESSIAFSHFITPSHQNNSLHQSFEAFGRSAVGADSNWLIYCQQHIPTTWRGEAGTTGVPRQTNRRRKSMRLLVQIFINTKLCYC